MIGRIIGWTFHRRRDDRFSKHARRLKGQKLYLREVLSQIADHPINRIEELLPWNFAARSSKSAHAA